MRYVRASGTRICASTPSVKSPALMVSSTFGVAPSTTPTSLYPRRPASVISTHHISSPVPPSMLDCSCQAIAKRSVRTFHLRLTSYANFLTASLPIWMICATICQARGVLPPIPQDQLLSLRRITCFTLGVRPTEHFCIPIKLGLRESSNRTTVCSQSPFDLASAVEGWFSW